MKGFFRFLSHYALDTGLLAAVAAVLGSSYILWFILPRGVGQHGDEHCSMQGFGLAGNYFKVLGNPRYVWVDWHSWAAIALLSVAAVHLLIHWRWVWETTKRAGGYFRQGISKAGELYAVSVILLALFIFEALSGIVVWGVMPRGAQDFYRMISGAGRTFLGLQRNIWVDLHGWVAAIIIAIVLVHLGLNWKWVTATSRDLVTKALGKPPRGEAGVKGASYEGK